METAGGESESGAGGALTRLLHGNTTQGLPDRTPEDDFIAEGGVLLIAVIRTSGADRFPPFKA